MNLTNKLVELKYNGPVFRVLDETEDRVKVGNNWYSRENFESMFCVCKYQDMIKEEE